MSSREYQAYLQGALHDGTWNASHSTHRFSQKGTEWLSRLAILLHELGHKSWIYREGKNRDVYVLETAAPFLDIDFDPDSLETEAERLAYVRGYFDAEGGLPRSPRSRFYIQITQKDRVELAKVRLILESVGISCGVLHNPSVEADPDYWRFFVRARSYMTFALTIRSWHPRKKAILERVILYPPPSWRLWAAGQNVFDPGGPPG
jgi:hypothetical protein